MGLFGGMGVGVFESSFRAYPVSFIDRPDLENGDKVVLPPSALDRISSLHIEYPLLFQISNLREGRTSHCGVLEFVAEEGVVYLPYWMMQNLLLQEGDIVKLKSTSLPKGTFAKLRAQSKDFLEITNPKAVLETTLRRYTCLTEGDSILINYNNKRYYVDILETKPQRAVTVIETDLQTDFAAPLDYVEPEPQFKPAAAAPNMGVPRTLPKPTAEAAAAEPPAPEVPKFTAFVGTAKRLDGKDVPQSAAPPAAAAAAAAAAARAAAASGSGAGSKDAAAPAAKSTAGKLVFGSRPAAGAAPGGAAAAKPAAAAPPPDAKPEPPKFTPFSGTGNKLK